MEGRDLFPALFACVPGQGFRQIDGAVLAAGAAEGDGHVAAGLATQAGQPGIEEAADLPRITRSAEQSLANEVIAKLPNQYDQQLGKQFVGGQDLSGGEWQKLAIARAYMREASIIILDEPTAALDARAESEVFSRFKSLSEKSTALLISHRFSTVRMADRIVVLDEGKVLEAGTHHELMALHGHYAELFDLQAAGYR